LTSILLGSAVAAVGQVFVGGLMAVVAVQMLMIAAVGTVAFIVLQGAGTVQTARLLQQQRGRRFVLIVPKWNSLDEFDQGKTGDRDEQDVGIAHQEEESTKQGADNVKQKFEQGTHLQELENLQDQRNKEDNQQMPANQRD
jgi:hypothetical protein